MLKVPSSVYFESYAFVHSFPALAMKDQWDKYDYVGTLSWKAPLKFKYSFDFGHLSMKSVLQKAPNSSDVIAFVGEKNAHDLLNKTNRLHPRFQEVWSGLLSAFNRYSDHEISTVGMTPFYCNYWLARPQHVRQLILFLTDAHGFLQNLTTIQEALWSNAGYLSNKKLSQAVFGLDYYAYHPFVLERLTPFFFNSKNLNIFVHKKLKAVTNLDNLTPHQQDEMWSVVSRFSID